MTEPRFFTFLMQCSADSCGFYPEMPILMEDHPFVMSYCQDIAETKILQEAMVSICRKRMLQQIMDLFRECGIRIFQDQFGHRIETMADAGMGNKCLAVPERWDAISASLGAKFWIKIRSSGVSNTKIIQLRETMIDTLECAICKNTMQNCIVFGCGHGACDACSGQLTTCHICRLVIGQRAPNYTVRDFMNETV